MGHNYRRAHAEAEQAADATVAVDVSLDAVAPEAEAGTLRYIVELIFSYAVFVFAPLFRITLFCLLLGLFLFQFEVSIPIFLYCSLCVLVCGCEGCFSVRKCVFLTLGMLSNEVYHVRP